MKCKCDQEMRHITTEKDYGDTVGEVDWCPRCGRVCLKSIPIQFDEESEEQWFEPGCDAIHAANAEQEKIAKRLRREMDQAVERDGLLQASLDLKKEKGAR